MATTQRIDGDLEVCGSVVANILRASSGCVADGGVSPTADIARTKLGEDVLAAYPVPLIDFRVHDAPRTKLPLTAGTDDLGYVAGTFGADRPHLTAGDCKATTITRYARRIIPLPMPMLLAGTCALRIHAGMVTTLADTSATVDVDAYLMDTSATLGAQLCTTSAQSMNSLTTAAYDFLLDTAGENALPGWYIDARIAVAVVDSATATAVEPRIYAVSLVMDIQG